MTSLANRLAEASKQTTIVLDELDQVEHRALWLELSGARAALNRASDELEGSE